MKELKDISWQVSEEEYRKDPALSYSILAKYEREGFNGLEHLFDHVDSPSLTFGSAVDAYITGGEEEFNSKFAVADCKAPEPSIVPIVKDLYKTYSTSYTDLWSIPTETVAEVAAVFNYQPRWKAETRVNKIKTDGADYYRSLFLANDKTILPQNVYNKVYAAVRALKDSPQTAKLFQEDNPFDKIKRYYQLKFKATLGKIDYRCMADLLLVDYANKKILPVDLKTSSKPEWEFPKSFIEWNYQIQARLYWRIIRENLDNDPYFKDFELLNYLFVIVSQDAKEPLLWEFENSNDTHTLIFGKHEQWHLRDPEVIAHELKQYLDTKHSVPLDINVKKKNSITDWLDQH